MHRPTKRIAILATALFFLPLTIFFAVDAQVWEPGDPVPAGMDFPEDTGPRENRLPTPPPRVLTPETGVVTSSSDAAVPPAPPPISERPPALSVAEDPEDFLCSRAPVGKAVRVPPPFDRWLVLVCTQEGQALVPVMGEAWVAHGSADPVSIFALPPGGTPPSHGPGFDPRYDIRFLALTGGETQDERRERALDLLRLATNGSETLPDYREIWQLDALSNAGGARYNLFFYRDGERPTRIIACLDQCAQALHLDVLSGDEARDALGR
ncbi:MAG: hypothetical protein KF765_05200 [Parvibaculaceae bacterium]|nr:hypothetical protein [Parvibaculaceae bacterium]